MKNLKKTYDRIRKANSNKVAKEKFLPKFVARLVTLNLIISLLLPLAFIGRASAQTRIVTTTSQVESAPPIQFNSAVANDYFPNELFSIVNPSSWFRSWLYNGKTKGSNSPENAASNFTLTPSTNSVAPGGALSISWNVPAGQATNDWIALYKVGDPNTTYQWWKYVSGPATGTFSLTAPTTPGDYEFRYLLSNGYTHTATSSTVTVGSGPPPPSASLSKARLEPINATGGTNLYSRNFGWGTGIAGLPGRAGLDAGFGLTYNSLIWTKDGTTMNYDPDVSNAGLGFRMGFPVIEPFFYDADTGKNTYLMVTPSGGRAEFRQVGSGNTYESPDSSYTELKVNSSSSITVTGTDGTKVSYTLKGSKLYVSEVKDSNGNYITVNHDTSGKLLTVTDTLGRVITVNYSAGLPSTIRQTWKNINGAGSNVTYTYATLTYVNKTITPSFHGSLSLSGITSGTSVKVLDKIKYANNAYTKFDYNNFGQVWKVTNYAEDNGKLSHVSTNLNSPGSNLLDAPRFSQTKSWIKSFNQNGSGVEQEVVIPNTFQTNQSYSTPGGSGTGTLVQVTAPNGTISKTYFGNSTWKEGLPIVTEDWANPGTGLARQRWTHTTWTQDNPSANYVLNPRVTESKVGDISNTRRTTISYHSTYGLVNEVKVYDTNQTTVLKKTATTYNLASTYTSRHIIGLVAETKVYGPSNLLVGKTTYSYDEGNFGDSSLQQNISPINHDNSAYGSSFIVGRGNLTSTTRWDAIASTNVSLSIKNQIKYNTAGAPVAQIDPLNRQIKILYNDSFNDNINRNSYAYATKLYDPAGNFSEVKYRFDAGANVWAKSPAPAGNSSGKETTREYDSLGRLQKEKVVNSGAYTRYEYPTSGIHSKVYSTVTDMNGNNTGDAADEILTERWTDGAGRTRQARTEHPGSIGGYSGTVIEYDVMGRVKRSTVPTEVNTSWAAVGDDATRGFLWQENEYDWNGRVTRAIGTDGTDKLYSYEGCGCAGGQVTTIKGETITETNWTGGSPVSLGRRTQKIYADILGRAYKTEVLNWNGSVYTSTQTTFDGRDQATKVERFAGTVGSSPKQTTTITYDGHGRLKTQKRPQQTGTSSYIYNKDDSIQRITDGRAAKTDYTYNTVGLPTQIAYTAAGGAVATPTATNVYDNIGNRTQMTDGRGTTTYTYNQLSQMTSETRGFNDSLPDAPIAGNKFKIEYTYALGGLLKSIKDPYGKQINYAHDKAGRLSTVTGTSFGGITTYANTSVYTARQVLKSVNYGNGVTMNVTSFNNKLQATGFHLKKGSTDIMKKDYDYYGDGQLKKLDDYLGVLTPTGSEVYDRTFKYDHVGRVVEAKTGEEARGGTVPPQNMELQLPYRQSYVWSQFDNLTARNNLHWGKDYTAELGSFILICEVLHLSPRLSHRRS